MPKTSYFRSAILQHIIDEASYSAPATLYLGLLESDPTIENIGGEISGGSYARQAISWSAEDNGRAETDSAITFTDLPACTITYWGIYDSSTSGELLYFKDFELPIIRSAGQGLEIDAGRLAIGEI